jgi:RNA polymerase sigma-70 factor (ECF subfamily)
MAEVSDFDAVFEQHFAYVYRSLLRLGVADREAEDLAQEVFVVVHRRLHTYDPERPVRPWLFGIAFNVARDWRKRASTRYETLTDAPDDPNTDPGIRAVEAAQLVHRALRQIPEMRRPVFVLYELDKVPMPVVAEALSIPVDTAYSRLRVARTEFRAAVELLRGSAP